MPSPRSLLAACAACLATALVLSAYGEGPARERLQVTARGHIPVPAGATVTTTCNEAVVHVSICSDPQHCTEALTAPCAAYGCDAAKKWCASSCVTSADCSAGSVCDTINGKCAWMPYQCADTFAILGPTGQLATCAPYKCLAGRCQQQCQTDADCSSGYACHDHVACVKK